MSIASVTNEKVRLPRESSAPQSDDVRRAARNAGPTITWVYLFNALVALAMLVFFGPLMIMIGLVVRWQDRGPSLFAHQRIGRDGRSFPCFKFRSMAVDAEERLRVLLETDPYARAEWERDHKLVNDPRVTPLGRFLRKSSLDELPQLLNVLRGEMNLVGPRPIVAAEVVRYGRWFREYCQVKPGITGLWQISGRSDVDYRQRVALDVCYVRNQSFLGDLRILLLTVPVVLISKGAH